MNIIVFGASGNGGSHFVRFASAAGHHVTAVVRAATAYEPPPGAKLLYGDVLDAEFVASAVPGHDCVMRYKHPWARRESPDDFTSRATGCIVAAMKGAGVRRMSAISAAGVGDSRPGMNWPMRVMLAISNVGVAYRDLETLECILSESGLDWQAVRPVTLTHKPRTDKVRIIDRYPVTATIPREDVAAFMLRELESSPSVARWPAGNSVRGNHASICPPPPWSRRTQRLLAHHSAFLLSSPLAPGPAPHATGSTNRCKSVQSLGS